MSVVRFTLVTVGLTFGTLRDANLLALVLGGAGYALSPYVAHPLMALRARREGREYRRYLAEVRSGHGEPVDLGSPGQRRRALVGGVSPFRVFVSSTFVDLSRERELLARDLFPRMARECERRGAVWAPIDLRWGITDLQRDAGEVARICLRSVRGSLPNVIGIVGERYGTRVGDVHPNMAEADLWAGRSLTHLEMAEAITPEPAALSVFVLDRERVADDEAPIEEMLHTLGDAGARLVDRVRDGDHLVAAVEADLVRRLDAQFPGDPLANLLLREVSAHRRYEERLAAQSTLCAAVLPEIDAATAQGRVAVVRGREGSGRSSLMSAWARSWRARHPDDIVVCRFVGLTASSLTWSDLLRSIAGEVAMRADVELRLPDDDNELAFAVAHLFLRVQASRRVVVCLDSPHRIRTPAGMEGSPYSRGLGWLPQAGEEVDLGYVPMVVFEDATDFDWYAYPTHFIEFPELAYADRLMLVRDRLAAVDRALPAEMSGRIVEHPCSGHPAFLALLADELHRISSHEELSLAVRRMLRADSLEELVAVAVDRVAGHLDERQTSYLWALLTVLVRAPAGLTEVEIVALVGGIQPGFGQSDWELLRGRLASVVAEADGAWRVVPSLEPGVRGRVDSMVAPADLDRSWVAFYGGEGGLAPRSITMLRLVDNEELLLPEMRRICATPRGMVAIRSTFEDEFFNVLGHLSAGTGERVAEMIRAAVRALGEHDDLDTHLGLAAICVDYRLIPEAEHVLAEIPVDEAWVDDRAAERWLALRARASLRGGTPVPREEWDRMLRYGMERKSANVHLALSGIAVGLAREGNHTWAQTYFKRAFKAAFASGNIVGIVTAGPNTALSAVADSPRSTLRLMSRRLRPLLDKAVSIGMASGDVELILAALLRRSVLDVYLGATDAADEGFEVVRDVAADQDHEHYLRLSALGRALVLASSGRQDEAAELASQWELALGAVEPVLRSELLQVIV